MATRVKEKAAARKANADKRPHATAKYVRVYSPQGQDRRRSDPRQAGGSGARDSCVHPEERGSRCWRSCSTLRSPMPRTTSNMDRASLYVAEVYANQGPTLKRYWARSHGRADMITKRTSHITIVLDQK